MAARIVASLAVVTARLASACVVALRASTAKAIFRGCRAHRLLAVAAILLLEASTFLLILVVIGILSRRIVCILGAVLVSLLVADEVLLHR